MATIQSDRFRASIKVLCEIYHNMFITAVCSTFFITLRWPEEKVEKYFLLLKFNLFQHSSYLFSKVSVPQKVFSRNLALNENTLGK